MIEDPIVEEIHRTRERLLEEHGGLDGFLKHIRQMQAELPQSVKRLPPRLPVESARKSS
jgi:hypothetical protein